VKIIRGSRVIIYEQIYLVQNNQQKLLARDNIMMTKFMDKCQ